MKLSVFLNEWKDVPRSLDAIVDAERRGFHGVWIPSITGFDPVVVAALAGSRTERILVGTSVVPTFPRHPVAMAQEAQTANIALGGRFRLGIGTSHVPVIENMYGIPFEKPIRHMREYVEVVKALVRDGSVAHQGELYRVTMGLDLPEGRGFPVMISVLSEQMSRLAGRVADGAITWLAPASYIASTVVPLVKEGAEQAGRPAPPVVAQVPATCSTDPDDVRKVVRRLFAVYPHLPFYNTMMQKAGLPGAADALGSGWSDELIDAVIPYGDEAALADRVQEYLDAGADEVVFSPFPTGGDWKTELPRVLDAFASIATT